MEDQINISDIQTDQQPPKKKPVFDPNKPFKAEQDKGKPSFDEGKPFEEVKKKRWYWLSFSFGFFTESGPDGTIRRYFGFRSVKKTIND